MLWAHVGRCGRGGIGGAGGGGGGGVIINGVLLFDRVTVGVMYTLIKRHYSQRVTVGIGCLFVFVVN